METLVPYQCAPPDETCETCGATPGRGCLNEASHFLFPDLEPAKDVNPKDVVGGPKFSLSILPIPGLVQLEPCFRDGAAKYGPSNWRDQPVSSRVYVDACFRHLMLWLCGQEASEDSGVCHLASAASNLLILLDARACGTMKDDRIQLEDAEVLAEIFEELRASRQNPTLQDNT